MSFMSADTFFFFYLTCVGIAYGLSEHFLVFNTPFSKYRSAWLQEKAGTMDPHRGFVILYSMSLPGLLLGIAVFGFEGSLRSKLGAFMYVAHFLKRIIECAFVHVYSAPMDCFTVGYLGTCYLVIGQLIAFDLASGGVDWLRMRPEPLLCLGVGLWFVGEASNCIHHWLLRTLRKKSGLEEQLKVSGEYVMPKGYLFDFVLFPHYLGEMVAWLGVALVINRGAMYGLWAFMCFMQCGRASAGKSWYIQKFGADVVASKKLVFPFLW